MVVIGASGSQGFAEAAQRDWVDREGDKFTFIEEMFQIARSPLKEPG